MKRLLLSGTKITMAGNQVHWENKAFVKNNKTGQITNLRQERIVWMLDKGCVEFPEAGPLRICAGMTVTTMGLVLARPLLAPVDEESAPMEDGEGREGESMQEGGDPYSGLIPTGQEEEGEDQGVILTSQFTVDF